MRAPALYENVKILKILLTYIKLSLNVNEKIAKIYGNVNSI